MILRVNTADKLMIISEDPMDAEFLESFFEDSLQIEKESDFIHRGFHKTSERSVCVTFTKQKDGKDA